MKTRSRRVSRRIAVVTGTRAEYGLLQSTLEAIDKHPDLKLQLVVTGMHLLKKFGGTISQIRRDGWTIAARVPMQRGDDSPLDQSLGLSRGIAGIARFLPRARTDIVVVLGDRIEAMAGALAAITTGRLLAHIHGGDIAQGDFDDSLRHAITKLAHLHLTATQAARRRVMRMGEDSSRVHCVGAPGLDRLRELVREGRRRKKSGQRALIVHHATGRSNEVERRTMGMILRATRDAGLSATVILPNSDRGHSGILAAIEAHRRAHRNAAIRVVPSLDRDTYLRILIESDVLVGNSSSGIIESAVAGTPAVNVGLRQRDRQRGGRSIFDADESDASIREALHDALSRRRAQSNGGVYGRELAGPKIAAFLAAMPLDEAFHRKARNF